MQIIEVFEIMDTDEPSYSYADSRSDSSDDSCFEVEGTPPKAKKAKLTKFTGAAKYKTKFNHDWTKEFPFITSVFGDQYRIT